MKSGKLSRELDFVSHHVRTKLDELKRQEVSRLRMLLKAKMDAKQEPSECGWLCAGKGALWALGKAGGSHSGFLSGTFSLTLFSLLFPPLVYFWRVCGEFALLRQGLMQPG